MIKKLLLLLVLILILDPGPALPDNAAAPSGHDAIQEAPREEARHHGEDEIGKELPLWSIIPFAGILLSIALFPLLAPHFWHRHFPKVSAFWAVVFAVPFIARYGGEAVHSLLHIFIIDYIPFIILLWALYTVSGGILVRGTLTGTPAGNVVFLVIGTFIASWIGTTGASMVLIRPVLRANAWRKKKVHIIIFFIFLVSNIGGSLTPLGDPPLFLGFLHGVPFFWTFRLLPHMGFAAVILIGIFYLLDLYYYRKEEKPARKKGEREKLSVRGLYNLIFLAGIVGAVLLSGFWKAGEVSILGVAVPIQDMVRNLIMVLMGLVSLSLTPNALRKENDFSWFPIAEVAYLFAGIFATIVPALAILKAGSEGELAFLLNRVSEPVHYFWITGGLSSFLDNAPTYLTFFNSALGKFFAGRAELEAVGLLIEQQRIYLEAISVGAVFMGANTYIGNAPNFMVKSIAEEAGIPMPSFFGFMFKYSLPILIPLFIIVTVVFFL